MNEPVDSNTAVDITFRLDRDADPVAVAEVYRSVGWRDLAEDPERLGRALRSSAEVATAWDGEAAVGVARMLSDGVFKAYIVNVAVRPDYRGRGVGSRLVEMLVASNPDLTFHLRTRSRRYSFYERLGFQRDETGMERPPR
jgi:ribosomal protein S18 acetylase RimI-like enzyme